MPVNVTTATRRTKKTDDSRTVRELVAVASQLPGRQFESLRKKLNELHLARWRCEREAIATRIADKGITEQSIDEYLVRRRREGRR